MTDKPTCCVCLHELDIHIEESKWWRCHALGPDFTQCECRCLKEIGEEEGLDWYDIDKRMADMLKDMKAI